MKLVPAIDLHGGRCVRLRNGQFDQVTRYDVDAVSLAQHYGSLGVKDLHIVDLDGARVGTQRNQAIVREIVDTSELDVQLGGGIRSTECIEFWFEAGVCRLVVGSIAVSDPGRVLNWLSEYGADRIVLAFDVNVALDGTNRVATHGWQRASASTLQDCMQNYLAAGLRHVLCTDIGRDGALAGPNLELYAAILEQYPGIALQASGGIRNMADLRALRSLGTPAAISGRALLDDKISITEIEKFLRAA